MNWQSARGKWGQLESAARAQWARLTEDDLHSIAGEREKLLGKIQERYGYAKDHAEHAIDEWIASVDTKPARASSASR